MKPVTPQRKILTDELKAKVTTRVTELLADAAKIWPDHAEQFAILPTISYDVKNAIGGMAISGGSKDWTIRLNLILCYENEDDFIFQTVGHEVAHLVQRKVFGFTKQVMQGPDKFVTKKVMSHGVEWKEVMVKLGLRVEKFHHYDIASIDKPKRKRAKAGSIIEAEKTMLLFKRLQNGYHRLPDEVKKEFAGWIANASKLV